MKVFELSVVMTLEQNLWILCYKCPHNAKIHMATKQQASECVATDYEQNIGNLRTRILQEI